MSDWHAIFKAGRHTDSAGITRDFSTADLDRTVQAYAPAEHEAPLVIGHPQTDSPAYGWVEALKRQGDTLLARFKQVPQEVKELVGAGRFKKVSVALYPDGRLRHVGLLGAAPPAVKGLGSVSFGDGEEWRCFEFADPEPGPAPNQEEEQMPPTQEEMDRLRREKEAADAKAQAAEEAAKKAGEEKALAEQKAQAAEEAKAKAETEFAEHRAAQAAQARQARFEELLKAGKALPGDKDKVLAFAEALCAAGGELTFSEDGKETKQPLEDALWEFLEARPASGLLGEYGEPETPGGDEGYDPQQAARKF